MATIYLAMFIHLRLEAVVNKPTNKHHVAFIALMLGHYWLCIQPLALDLAK